MTSINAVGWERALMAAEKVKERLRRAVQALEQAGVHYAVAGGNAVAEWVGRVDDEAVRNTRDVDLLIRRIDFDATRAALESAGFIYQHVWDVDLFIDGPQGKPSAGIHLLFAGEKVRAADEFACPEIDESESAAEFRVVTLPALVRMKLLAWRLKDQVHLQDLIGVRLIDASWPPRFPVPLAARLQQLLDHPEGQFKAAFDDRMLFVDFRRELQQSGSLVMPYYEFWWDDRNLAKIAINDVSSDDFEDVVCHPLQVKRSRSSGMPLAIGYASDGRLIACVYEPIDELLVKPITAFYIEPK